jgi:hypothetical protein
VSPPSRVPRPPHRTTACRIIAGRRPAETTILRQARRLYVRR